MRNNPRHFYMVRWAIGLGLPRQEEQDEKEENTPKKSVKEDEKMEEEKGTWWDVSKRKKKIKQRNRADGNQVRPNPNRACIQI